MNDTVTYREIQNRCTRTAENLLHEAVPMPEEGTREAWEAAAEMLEDLEVYELADDVDHWDWTIYTHYGLKIVNVMSSDELNDAEAEWHEMTGGQLGEGDGVYQLASQVAYLYLRGQLVEALDRLRGEMLELYYASAEQFEYADAED